LKESPIAPGEIVSIFGSGFGPVTGVAGKMTSNGTLETKVADLQLMFDGVAAPLFFVSDKQINAQVPYAVQGRASAEISIVKQGVVLLKRTVNVKDVAPGILTVAGGIGQAVAANQTGVLNGTQAAERGSVLTFYVTGDGQSGDGAVEGKPSEAVPTLARVQVEMGGLASDVLYAGRAPGFIGLMQVNARVPSGLKTTGAVSLVLRVAGEESQAGVTVQIK
jgi:uncharacterized protein (TIGR03437 family)